MEFYEHFNRKFEQLQSQNGKVPPRKLLQEISDLQQECLNHKDKLNKHDLQMYETKLGNFSEGLRRTQQRKFRLSLSEDPEPQSESAPNDGSTSTSPLSTRRHIQCGAEGAQNLKNCVVYDATVASANMSDLSNCIVLLPDVKGPIYISNATGCVFFVRCHQLRIRQSTSCRFYAGCTRPVIEDSSSLEFGSVEGWPKIDVIDDFDWMRPSPSPNWTGVTALAGVPEPHNLLDGLSSHSALEVLRIAKIIE